MVAGQGRLFERIRYRLPENNCRDIVPECWVVDWKEKRIEIYSFAEADSEEIEKYLKKTVTEKNKEELKISSLQNLQITFEELFQGI